MVARREFLSTSALLFTGLIPAAQAQGRSAQAGRNGNGVWRQLDAELERIYLDLKSNANAKPAAPLAALASTMRFMASYAQENAMDEKLRAHLAARGRADAARQGRERSAAREQLQRQRFPSVPIESYRTLPSIDDASADRAFDELLAHGYSPSVMAAADAVGDVAARVAAAGGRVVNAGHMMTMQDACPEMHVWADTLSAEAMFLGGAAYYIPELAPVAAEAALIAVTAYIAWETCEWWNRR